MALARINPEQNYPAAAKENKSTKSTKASTPAPMQAEGSNNKKGSNKKTRSEHFSDISVAANGRLTLTWLNTALSHLPVPVMDRSRCAMHRWLGIDTQKDNIACKACNVSVCIKCYECFRTTPDILGINNELREFYGKKTNEKNCHGFFQ
jgi:hypothetical protein